MENKMSIDSGKRLHLESIDRDRHRFIMFKCPDGKDYATIEGLTHAQETWKRQNLRYIVHDAVRGRIEIAPGTGEVRICIGHKIEHDYDADGVMTRREVPVYRTQTF
jgi:hypothetical protein